MLRRVFHVCSTFVLAFFVSGFAFLIIPSYAYAQYVPVNDEELIQAFNDYVQNDFANYVQDFKDFSDNFSNTLGDQPDGTTASIRDLISGDDPAMPGKNSCAQGDNAYPAEADIT